MLELFELVGRLFHGLGVWAFLFSKRYRDETLRSWQGKSRLAVAFEIFEFLIGFAITILLCYGAYMLATEAAV
jgi:hypothetical protein